MLKDEDIKKVWEGILVLNAENVLEYIKMGGSKPINLSNGYIASLSMDILSERNKIYHLSISNPKGKTDPKVAEIMAKEILGEKCTLLTIGSMSGCHQFIKQASNKEKENKNKKGVNKEKENKNKKGVNKEKENKNKKGVNKEKEKKEEKINEEFRVEGDVDKNGIKRGTKKKI